MAEAAVAEKPAAAAPAADAAKPAADAAKPAVDAAKPADESKGKTVLGSAQPKDASQDAGKTGAPEKYADFKLPEGLAVDEKLMDGFRALAKEKNFSQEDAQKFVDLQAQSVKAAQDAQLAWLDKQSKDWLAESQKHFGADFQKEFGIASKAIERFGDKALTQMLEETGLGNHPAWIKFAHAVGKAISEDQPIHGERKAGGEEKSTAALMFPTTPGKKA